MNRVYQKNSKRKISKGGFKMRKLRGITAILLAAVIAISSTGIITYAVTKTFKIQYSVSGNFTAPANNCSYSISAYIVDYNDNIYDNTSHHYEMTIYSGLITKFDQQFTTGKTWNGSLSLSKDKKYGIKFINNDSISTSNYVSGSCTITKNS